MGSLRDSFRRTRCFRSCLCFFRDSRKPAAWNEYGGPGALFTLECAPPKCTGRLAHSEQCKGSDRAFWMYWVHDGWYASPLLSKVIVQSASRCPTASRRAVRDPEISLSGFRNTEQNTHVDEPNLE